MHAISTFEKEQNSKWNIFIECEVSSENRNIDLPVRVSKFQGIKSKGNDVLPQNRSFDSVWSKIRTLQDCIVLCKSAAMPLPTLWFLTTNESFQMRYCMNFFFKGHQNCQKSNLKVHEKSCFIKWIWKAKTLTSGHSDAPWGKSSYSTSFESSH